MNWTIDGAYERYERNDVVLKKEFLDWVRSIGFEEFLRWGDDEWERSSNQQAEEYYEQVLANTGDKEHAEKMKDMCYMAEEIVHKAPWLYLQQNMLEFLLYDVDKE